MNLPELVRLSNELRLYLVESNGEISDEMAQGLAILETNLPTKCDSYKFVIDDMELETVKWKERADEFTRVSRGYKSFVERLKDNLKHAALAMGKTELFGNDYRWKLQNSKPSVVIENEELIPGKYKTVVQTFKIDKDQMLADLQAGIDIQGARLERSQHVRCYPNGVKR